MLAVRKLGLIGKIRDTEGILSDHKDLIATFVQNAQSQDDLDRAWSATISLYHRNCKTALLQWCDPMIAAAQPSTELDHLLNMVKLAEQSRVATLA